MHRILKAIRFHNYYKHIFAGFVFKTDARLLLNMTLHTIRPKLCKSSFIAHFVEFFSFQFTEVTASNVTRYVTEVIFSDIPIMRVICDYPWQVLLPVYTCEHLHLWHSSTCIYHCKMHRPYIHHLFQVSNMLTRKRCTGKIILCIWFSTCQNNHL